jgi:hypothetical protein
MKAYWGMELLLHAFLISALDGCEWPASRRGRLYPQGNNPYPLDRRLGGPQSLSGPRWPSEIWGFQDREDLRQDLLGCDVV